jgi:hypothetical protein
MRLFTCRIGPRPYHGQDTDSEEAEAQENMLHLAAGDRPQTYDMRDVQLNCPALEVRCGVKVSWSALAGLRLTLDVQEYRR